LLRIVAALDGGICRVKLAGGELQATQAEAVALAAERYASGVIEATNRANLQLRGVGDQQRPLIDALLAAGLGPRLAGGDDVRNVMLSPAAGLDRRMLLDVRPLAAQVLHSLESEPRYHALSAKFAVQLDGGEGLAMLEHHHDVWVSARQVDGQTLLAWGLAGCAGSSPAWGLVPMEQGHTLVMGLLQRFLQLASPQQSRMRELLAAGLGEAFGGAPGAPAARVAEPVVVLGIHPQQQPGLSMVVASAPLGRLDSTMLRGVAVLARQYGDCTLRITPWQGVLLPNVAHAHAPAAQAALLALGFVTDAQQPLAPMIACTGSAGCARGQADTKADAVHLGSLLQQRRAPLSVHLSACGRSCAAAHVAPVTLLASRAGHYDVYFRDASQPGFGALQARDLSLDAAAVLLDGCSRSDTHD
jgi:precorrin-3B synthase